MMIVRMRFVLVATLLSIICGVVVAQLVQDTDFRLFARDAIDRAEVVATGMALATWHDPPSNSEFRVFYTIFRTPEGVECVAVFPSTRSGQVAGVSCQWK